MYHLPDAVDFLQKNSYCVFCLAENLLKRPFIPCRQWLYLQELHFFCLTTEKTQMFQPALKTRSTKSQLPQDKSTQEHCSC